MSTESLLYAVQGQANPATNPRIGFSQLGQDFEVVRRTGGKRGGYFVEVGAHDGMTLSNSLLLELAYGWSGLCVEPNPASFKQLTRVRSCFCSPLPVSDKAGQLVEFKVCKPPMYSGITADPKAVEVVAELPLITATLTQLLDAVGAPSRIDYLSVDTEGTELDVLKGIDWAKYSFDYITCEHNFHEPARTATREYLAEKGYILARENQWDDDFKPQ